MVVYEGCVKLEHVCVCRQLSLVQRVCEPPLSRSSPLALNIARLLADPVLSDMTFVVVPPAGYTQPWSSCCSDNLHTLMCPSALLSPLSCLFISDNRGWKMKYCTLV